MWRKFFGYVEILHSSKWAKNSQPKHVLDVYIVAIAPRRYRGVPPCEWKERMVLRTAPEMKDPD
jgi:hypothetical protein